jgi:pimeloyl-ACP methyl ester carboxylesterase
VKEFVRFMKSEDRFSQVGNKTLYSEPTMRVVNLISLCLCIATISAAPWGTTAEPDDSAENGHRIRNIVLVHGAWVDGSSWKGVYDVLVRDGYTVSIVQEPLTSFHDDVAATKRILDQQKGDCILVAHSYGGSVITEAGMHSSVAALVYVAAHMPDGGESEADGGKRFPSDLSKSGAIKKTADGFDYLDPEHFREYFAADLTAEHAAFAARSQVLIANANFHAVITTPAWRSKASWTVVATRDKTINPDLERWYGSRAKSNMVEIEGASHCVFISHPKDVAAVIEEAARKSHK